MCSVCSLIHVDVTLSLPRSVEITVRFPAASSGTPGNLTQCCVLRGIRRRCGLHRRLGIECCLCQAPTTTTLDQQQYGLWRRQSWCVSSSSGGGECGKWRPRLHGGAIAAGPKAGLAARRQQRRPDCRLLHTSTPRLWHLRRSAPSHSKLLPLLATGSAATPSCQHTAVTALIEGC